MSKGGESGDFMPVTLGFALAAVEEEALFGFLEEGREALVRIIEEAHGEGYAVADWYSFDRTTVPGVVSVNNGGLRDIGRIDPTSAGDLTLSERAGIQVAVDFVRLARAKGVPGLGRCHLVRTGAAVGIREARRIIGEYVVTLDDARKAPEFDDVVARRYGALDGGGLPAGKGLADAMVSGHGFPYRALLPKGVDNLLVAGRAASATQLGQAAGKSMGNMMALGQAAGVAAALAAEADQSPKDIDVKLIQERLASMGVRL
jgi:hypothetical protein